MAQYEHEPGGPAVWAAAGILLAAEPLTVDTVDEAVFEILARAVRLNVGSEDVAAYVEWNGRLPV